MERPAGVPSTVLELVLEEIHLRRKFNLREWQESDRDRRARRDHDRLFSDDFGKDLEGICLVHPSWTSDARHILGRILVLSDASVQSTIAAASSPMFGLWTREVYLSFSTKFGSAHRQTDGTAMWDALNAVFVRIPAVLTFCLQTSAWNEPFKIEICADRLTTVLPGFTRLQTLRLYSELPYGYPYSSISFPVAEFSTLFRALENIPHFQCFAVRNFIPYYKPVHEKGPSHGDAAKTMSIKVASSSPLTGSAYSLAELIRSICNTPVVVSEVTRATSVANVTNYAEFFFHPTRQQFTIKSASIIDSSIGPVQDTKLPTYERWCSDLEYLWLSCPCAIAKSLSPFPSLKFLQASVFSPSNWRTSSSAMRDEMFRFLDSLPPTLEVLDVDCWWDVQGGLRILSPEMHDEIDGLWAEVPTTRCPKLKILLVDLSLVSKLFRTTHRLKRIINACENLKLPLVLFRGDEAEYYGNPEPQLEHNLSFESYIY